MSQRKGAHSRPTHRDVRLREGHGSSWERGDRAPARYCEVSGCGWATHHGKPWCRRHAHVASPYVLAMRPPEPTPGECHCGRPTINGRLYCQDSCAKAASAWRKVEKGRAS